MGTKMVYPHSDLMERIANRVESVSQKATQPDDCWGLQDSALDAEFVTIYTAAQPTQVPNWIQGANPADLVGGAANVPVNLKKARRCFTLVSIAQGNGADDIYFSVTPTGVPVPPTGAFPAGWPFGNENWFSLNGANQHSRTPPTIVLPNKITNFFLTMNTAAGTQYKFTLCCYDDPEMLRNMGFINS